MENVVTILNENVSHISLWEQVVNILPFVAILVLFAFGLHLIRNLIALVSFKITLDKTEKMQDYYTDEGIELVANDINKKYSKYKFYKKWLKHQMRNFGED